MSIYSANRSGSMGTAQAIAREGYTADAIGVIMTECVINDQKLFEACLGADFREVNALREGTITESEIRALTEANVKAMIENAKKALQAFWEKLKGAFKVAMENISAYILRDGKAFAAKYRRVAKDYKGGAVQVDKVPVRTDVEVKTPSIDELEKMIRNNMNNQNITKKDYAGRMLAKLVPNGGENVEPADYRKKMIEACFNKEGTVSSSDTARINKMLATLENASATIKGLSRCKKEAEQAIKKTAKAIQDVERGEGHKDAVKAVSILLGACQMALSTSTSTAIKITKMEVSASRKTLGKMMSKMGGGSEEAQQEAAVVGGDEVADALDDSVDQGVEGETQDAVNQAIADAESEIESESSIFVY